MARAIITFKIMPQSPEVDLAPIKEKAQTIARDSGAMGQMQVIEEPIAFGLVAVMVLGMYKMEDQDFEAIASKMESIPGVQSAEVYKMDLALG